MAEFSRAVLGVLVSLLAVASSAEAFGGRFGFMRGPTYYYAPAYQSYWIDRYCVPMPTAVPDARPGMPFARPTPAPPSGTNEPPLQKKGEGTSNDPRMPVITTAHALPGNFVPGASPLAKDRCRVGFWNLSGREVTVTIDGKSWTLPKNRSVTMDLDRQFTWQVAGQAQHVERVPGGQAAHEVLIRE